MEAISKIVIIAEIQLVIELDFKITLTCSFGTRVLEYLKECGDFKLRREHDIWISKNTLNFFSTKVTCCDMPPAQLLPV